MKVHWGSGGRASCILNLDTRQRWGGQLQGLVALFPGIDPGTHWTEGWVGATTSLDAVEKIRIPFPSLPMPGITPQSSSL